MLYIWPYIAFFSLPILLPSLLTTITSSIPPPLRNYIPLSAQPNQTSTLRQLLITIPTLAMMVGTIHYNTIIHPFTLADNRHYTFYVFRLLLRHPYTKYLAAPLYLLLAQTCITALGGIAPPTPPSPSPTSDTPKKNKSTSTASTKSVVKAQNEDGPKASFAILWLATSALSLVTAPLVEPRYFIIPWVVWRLHVPSGSSRRSSRISSGQQKKLDTSKMVQIVETVLGMVREYGLSLETVWYLLVNLGTGYVFLNWGFEWKQEKGAVQRFMW